MSILAKQIRIEMILFLRNRQNLFLTLAFPVMMILLFGAVFKDQIWGGVSSINFLVPGIVVMSLMMVCMNNNAVKIVDERTRGIYRRLFLTPLRRETLLLSNIVVRYLVTIVSALLVIAVGIGVYGADIEGSRFLFWLILTLGSLTFISLGFFLTSFAKNTSSVMTLCMAVLFAFMFLGGCFWPTEQLPESIMPLCKALPSYHLNAAFRMVVLQNAGGIDVIKELPVVIGWFVVSFILAVKFFKWE
ncbi:MAG: ABC transporter permease [Spirochaetales bacterium]|nr:ABC transporter permease [Spirochaetales bacterium]